MKRRALDEPAPNEPGVLSGVACRVSANNDQGDNVTTRNAGMLNASDIGNTITVPGGSGSSYAEAIRGELMGLDHRGPLEPEEGVASLRVRVLGQVFEVIVDADTAVDVA